jgi:hypothetical protein
LKTNQAESCKEGYGPKTAVSPMMMIDDDDDYD